MKIKLFSIFDVVSKEFFPPFVAKNDDVAKRIFFDGLKKNPHPEDYSLFLVGDFDDEIGIVSGLESISNVCAGIDFSNKEEK